MKSTAPLAVDEAIDLVARDMTEVAHVDLTRRVLDRLEPRRGASPWLRLGAGAGLAAAAALMLALWWPRTRPHIVPVATTPAGPAKTTTVPGLEAVATNRLPSEPRARRSPGVSAEDAAWLARAVPPLPPAPPISIDSIQPAALSIAPITVEPFGPQAIQVPGIDVRNSGGH